ncbi:MAG: arylesterase [Rhizobiales bacterium]|nr:arylesterase [Hyphomicrobiales bacterium]
MRLFVFLAVIFLQMQTVLAGTLSVLVLGDSLSAGHGLGPPEAFTVKLEAALRARGHDVKIVNAGISGDTAAAGLARLDWSLDGSIDAVIVELGANDALRGLPVAQAEQALDQILAKLGERKLPVLLAGMQAPRNMGAEYAATFDPIYARLAEKHGSLLYPFFLEGVAVDPGLNQPDGLHPNGRGVDVIVGRILPYVEKLLGKAAAK